MRKEENGLFSFLTEKKVTYKRNVKKEREKLEKERKRQEIRDVKAMEVEERKRKAFQKRTDEADRKIREEWREKGFRNTGGSGGGGQGRGRGSVSKQKQRGYQENYRRKNGFFGPSSEKEEAVSVAEGFHGRKTDYREDVIEIERYRSNLAHLGDLVELEILDKKGGAVTPIGFPEHDSEGHVSVGSTTNRKQLIFSGGDQGIDLESLELSEIEKEKDYVCIGECYSISYFTDKHHLTGPKYQKKGTEYIHVFGEEEGGERPKLVYNTLNCSLILVGGSYEVRDEGIYN